MITRIPAPPNAPEWFVKWLNELNRVNADTVNRSQGKTNPSSNIQNFTVDTNFTTDGSGDIQPINILNKLPVNARNVLLGKISRLDGVAIAGTPQIVWAMNGKNITISSIGGLANNTSYSVTFNINL